MIAFLEGSHAWPDINDDARALVAEDHREKTFGIRAGARELIRVTNARRLDLDEHFTRLRPFKIHCHHFERLAGGITNSSFRFHGFPWGDLPADSMRLPLSSIRGMR